MGYQERNVVISQLMVFVLFMTENEKYLLFFEAAFTSAFFCFQNVADASEEKKKNFFLNLKKPLSISLTVNCA